MKLFLAAGSLVLGSFAAACSDEPGSPFPSGWPPPVTTGSTTGTTTTGGGKVIGTYDKPVTVALTPPPPVSGGTLTLVDHGHKVAVADSDRDKVVVVDLDLANVVLTIPLEKGDEPGRAVEDGTGYLHVVLRGSGVIATLDVGGGRVLSRDAVCANPRGIAYDPIADVVHVACVGGELVTLPARGGAPIRTLKLDRDLRDIVVEQERLLVSRFRAAEVLVVERDGTVSARLAPRQFVDTNLNPRTFRAAVAWRMVAAPGGGVLLTHQEHQTSEVTTQPGAYGEFGCGGIVRTVVSHLRPDGYKWISESMPTVLAVDIAATPDLASVSVAGAGAPSSTVGDPIAVVTDVIVPPPPTVPPGAGADAGVMLPKRCLGGIPRRYSTSEQVVAVAYDRTGRLLVQTRTPTLWLGSKELKLPGVRVEDTGHELFHLATPAVLACASCHPEGREDGHVWTFSELGMRRTQSLEGGILGTEPFHWDGDMDNFETLSHRVFNDRMGGPFIQREHITALANWIDSIPPWRKSPPLDAAAVERGRALFSDPSVGCTSCHSGIKLTNNTTVDVGTGVKFQVSSLRGLAFRAPYLHGGCARTIADRFSACGGGDKHGNTSSLTTAQLGDLVAFLETL